LTDRARARKRASLSRNAISAAEIAVVGNEGIVGISLFMGGESTPSRAVVQSAGYGFRLKSAIVKDEFNQAGPVLQLLLRYTQAQVSGIQGITALTIPASPRR
jgi:hypothetical protein